LNRSPIRNPCRIEQSSERMIANIAFANYRSCRASSTASTQTQFLVGTSCEIRIEASDHYFEDRGPKSLQSVAWQWPAVEGTPWKSAFFLLPSANRIKISTARIEGHPVSLLWHIPISDAERAYKEEHGAMRCWIVCRKRSYRGSLMRPIDHRFWTGEPLVTKLWADGTQDHDNYFQASRFVGRTKRP